MELFIKEDVCRRIEYRKKVTIISLKVALISFLLFKRVCLV